MGFTTGGPRGVGVITSPFTPKSDMGEILAVIAARGAYLGGLTQAERDAISGAALFTGLSLFNTTSGSVEIYTGSGWAAVASPVTSGTVTFTGIYSSSGSFPVSLVKSSGRAFLEGVVASSTATFVAGNTYTLGAAGAVPSGFRPSVRRTFACVANVTALGSVDVLADGSITLTLNTGFTGVLSLDLSGSNWRV